MGIEIKKPEDFKIIFIGGDQLKQDTESVVKAGNAEFLPADSEEAKAMLEGHPELKNAGDLAIVADEGADSGSVCLISAVGKSLIIHCEDKILPIKEALKE